MAYPEHLAKLKEGVEAWNEVSSSSESTGAGFGMGAVVDVRRQLKQKGNWLIQADYRPLFAEVSDKLLSGLISLGDWIT